MQTCFIWQMHGELHNPSQVEVYRPPFDLCLIFKRIGFQLLNYFLQNQSAENLNIYSIVIFISSTVNLRKLFFKKYF